ncbi:MAG: hypothetical protein V7677_10475 [Motiliproteus sp.]
MKKWTAVIGALVVLPQSAASAEAMNGMYYCTETASVGIEDGVPKTIANDKFTVKIKDGVVTLSGPPGFANTFGEDSNMLNINHNTGWVYAQKEAFDNFSLQKSSSNYRYVSTTRYAHVKENGNKVTFYHYLSEGTCDKW